MSPGIIACIACGVLFAIGRLIKRRFDRLAVVLQVFAAWGVLNFLDTNYPTDERRFGYGCPWKWQYDPAYKHSTGPRQQQSATPQDRWQFDGQSLLLDVAVGLGILVAALIGNEVWQRSQGQRFEPSA